MDWQSVDSTPAERKLMQAYGLATGRLP